MKTCKRGIHQYDGRQCPECQRVSQRRGRLMKPERQGPWNMPLPPHTLDVLRWETFKADIVHRIEMVRYDERVRERRAAS